MNADFRLASAFLASHPKDAAHVLERCSAVTSATLLARCAPVVIAETLRQMPSLDAAAVLARLPTDRVPRVLSELSPGAAASMLRPLDPEERERLLAAAPKKIARPLRAALDHPEGSAGSLMDSNLLTLPAEISAGEARRRLRHRSRRSGNYLFLVDDEHRPVGAISLGELMLASSTATLATLMRSSVASLSARADTAMILALPGWRELHALPVVDSEGILVGILRRETYERLREDVALRGPGGRGGVGLALAELFWTLSVSMADELGRAVRPDAVRPQVERSDDS